MGTSSSGKGPRPTTPLIPGWIADALELPTIAPESLDSDTGSENSPETGEEVASENTPTDNQTVKDSNRYLEARRNFTSFSKNTVTGTSALRDSLRSYVKRGSGGSSTLAKRMRPSASRISRFHSVVNTFKEQGAAEALKTFNLEQYSDKPLLDVLSALTDVIFDATNPYNNIQDDSITKLAYVNTINRVVEMNEIDLDTLTNENVEVMIAIFIEETIATRVICDVGTSLFKAKTNCKEIIEAEETIYDIVSGMVRNQIMPEIKASQRGLVKNIEKSIQNIYRIAFDCIAGTIQQ